MNLLMDLILWGGTGLCLLAAWMFAKDAWNGYRMYRHDRAFTEKAIEQAGPTEALILKELFNRRPKRRIE